MTDAPPAGSPQHLPDPPPRSEVDAVVAAPERLAAVDATGLLDSPPEPAFDTLTKLAARLLGVPAAFMALVDEDRDFYKAACGFGEPLSAARELHGRTFCHYTVADAPGALVIPDTHAHPAYRQVPTVDTMDVRAYLGVPLYFKGQPIGSLCAIDHHPRAWSPDDVEVLTQLAASAQREIELRLALDTSRRAAEELERVHREHQELLDATTDGVYTMDREGTILFANRAAAELLGFAPEEMMGRNAHDLFHHSYPDGTPYPRAECSISRAARAGMPVHVSGDVLWRKNGTPLPVAYASSPVHRDGQMVGAVVRFTDIAEQKRATEGLQLLAESGRLLSASLDENETLQAIGRMAVPQLAEMVVVDLIEGLAMRRAAWSHASEGASPLLERASQFPPALDDGGPQAQVIASGEALLVREVDDEWIVRASRAPEHADIMRELVLRSVIVAPLRSREAMLGTVTFVRCASRPPFEQADVAVADELARRGAMALENARLYDAARRATRARDDMLGVVSHDLRNPIHSVFMSSSFLLDVIPEEGRDMERKQLAIIRRAAERANRLIQDLLDITHIESGRLSLHREVHKAASIAGEAVELAGIVAADQGISLVRGVMDGEARVNADRDRVLQALGNLIGNALKFTPSGGTVTVGVEAEGNEVRFSVADTGTGIAPEQVDHLFNRYWQANTADRRGVGLGLSIVKGIADAHGGRVAVKSELGRGTTFTLALPTA
ncbi:GAF domain-containing protein [Longimicrobium sp.]|jgi:PAS domain S-box-containing protein|uniref:sensor histidine kinase n=1 Tax=Longimicrobium sp. TaxID=2029185 RepID=UPI002F946854